MGTTNALGGVVRAWDVRDVSDQVISMGGKWITVDFKEDGAGAGRSQVGMVSPSITQLVVPSGTAIQGRDAIIILTYLKSPMII